MSCPSCGGELERESVGQNVTRQFCPECNPRSSYDKVWTIVFCINAIALVIVMHIWLWFVLL